MATTTTEKGETMNYTDTVTEALEAEGCSVKFWEGATEDRLYIRQGGKELGYLVVGEDDGGTGTCKMRRRAGWVAGIVRRALGRLSLTR